MTFIGYYDSPLGRILLSSNENGLSGLWFEGCKYYKEGLGSDLVEEDTPFIQDAKRWLDDYFSGKRPALSFPLSLSGSEFRVKICRQMLSIPYGETVTYKELARREGTAARAVGTAVGHNPISIIIPCHRVIGSDGSLTGYSSGIDRKIWLLRHEGHDL